MFRATIRRLVLLGCTAPLALSIAFADDSVPPRMPAVLARPPVTEPAKPATPPAAPAPKGVHYLYLIRHGIYDRSDSTSDVTGNGLNALGHEQATLTGRYLAALPVKWHAIVASNYLRARNTADDIAAALHMPVVEDTLIHECTPTAEHPEYNTNHTPADIAQCVDNLEAAWTKYFVPTPAADTHDLLVCHGNVTRWLTLKALGADVRKWYSMDIANASLTVIAVRPDGTCRLVTYSSNLHLPVEKQTWAGKGAGWKVAGK